MSIKTYFNGEMISVPGAYSAIDTSEMNTSDSTNGAKIVALVGESKGGEPETVHFFNDPISAKKVLKGGNLLKAAEKAWKPVSATKEGLSLGELLLLPVFAQTELRSLCLMSSRHRERSRHQHWQKSRLKRPSILESPLAK